MKTLSTKIVYWSDLPDDLKEQYPYHQDDFFLIVKYKKEIIAVETDGGEPEDMRFFRDLSWIPHLLDKAYHLGYQEGYSNNPMAVSLETK